MPRGSKSADILTGHRTKAELESRRRSEAALLTGQKCFQRESVRNNPVAHKEFIRITKLLSVIGKNDAIYGASINRYCELFAETEQSRGDIVTYRAMIDKLEKAFDELTEIDYDMIADFNNNLTKMIKQINAINSAVMAKRKMMADIEKENGWTVLSALRAIPKTAEKNDDDALIKALRGEDDEAESG